MTPGNLKNLIKDWRVATLIVLLVLSVVAIYPHFDNKGNFTTNLQYGLDLQNGAFIQLKLNAEVIGYTTNQPVNEFVANLSKSLDAEVIQVDANHLEIRKSFTQAELDPIFSSSGGKIVSYQQGVSKTTADLAKQILDNKLNTGGTQDVKVIIQSGIGNVAQYIRVEMAGVDMNQAQELVGKQGKFEIRIVTTNNQTDHIVFGDSISSVGNEEKDLQSGSYNVPFTLSESGAKALQDAVIKYGATTDPTNHNLVMILDNVTVFSGPLASNLASELRTTPVRAMQASTGIGDSGLQQAKDLAIHLRAGALPVGVQIVGSETINPEQGAKNKAVSLIAGILALITVGFVIYYRYREPGIVLPMVLINASEMIILLGFMAAIRFQMDLPTIAGLIAVLGTGIDQLVVITDEILHEGKVPSPNIYLKRLARALMIIVTAAATVVIAMVPLMLMPLTTLQGFALITILGVLVGVIVTRPAYGRIIMQVLSK
jgi:Preprotein translocase subunit SecD